MSVKKEDILDGFTCKMFGLDPESQGPKIAEYILGVLHERKYDSIHGHGWSMLRFRKNCYEYGIWIEDMENIMYGIVKYTGKCNLQLNANKSDIWERYIYQSDLEYLPEFLRDVDSNKWGHLEEISLKLTELEKKYGEDFFHILRMQAY